MAGQVYSVLNNFNSITSQRNAGIVNHNLGGNLQKISSGMRINNAADDAAGLAIANSLSADYNALSQAVRNANDGIGIVQIADGAFSRMGDMLSRASTLATQAASDTIGDNERRMIDTEFQQILEEIDRVIDTTNFKGERLFSDNETVNKSLYVGDTHIQSTIDLSIGGVSGSGTEAMGLDGTSLRTASDAQSTLSRLQDAIGNVSQWRGVLGAQHNRLENSINIIQVQSQNILAAESAIRDTNMAEEMSRFTNNKILLQSSMATIAQSNATSAMVLSLFGK